MEIRLAKTAGFCFGVNRAVELTYNLLDEGHKVATLGPLIHNPQAVADMERRGALVVDTVDDIPTGYEVIIRSHGVPRSIYDTLEQRGLVYHDATCPFVKKIQNIAAKAEAEGAVLLVAGGYRPSVRRVPQVLAFLFGSALPIYFLNKPLCTNFYFLNNPYGNVITTAFTNLLGEKYYILGFLPAIAAALALMYLPWVAAARRK